MALLKLRPKTGAHRPKGWARFLEPGETIDESEVSPDHRDKFELADVAVDPSIDSDKADPEDDSETYLPPLKGEGDVLTGPFKFLQFGPKRWCVIDTPSGKRVNQEPMEKGAAKAMMRELNGLDRPRKGA